MSEPFIGEIRPFPYTFAPYGWSTCEGQLLSVPQNQALFALLGNTFGGDGQTTFGVPNLKDRAPRGVGQGAGLSPCIWGQISGNAQVALGATQMPAHTHGMFGVASTKQGDASDPTGKRLAGSGAAGRPPVVNPIFATGTPNATLAPQALAPFGAGSIQPHENRQPFQNLNYCIALTGYFPSRG